MPPSSTVHRIYDWLFVRDSATDIYGIIAKTRDTGARHPSTTKWTTAAWSLVHLQRLPDKQKQIYSSSASSSSSRLAGMASSS